MGAWHLSGAFCFSNNIRNVTESSSYGIIH